MQNPLKRRLLKYYFRLLPIFFVGLIFVAILQVAKTLSPYYEFVKANNITPQFLKSLIFNTDIPIKKYKGRTNIVILGMSGGTYEGADLTDSILFLSLDWNNNDTVLLSIPRDLWMESLKARINTAYHYGEEKKKGGGLILAKSVVAEVLGIPVHYAWLIDFNAFTKMIDLVGGIDIDVPEKIDDKFYPIAGREEDFCGGDPTFACRYENLVIEKGLQHMNGELALKYVRSRGTEGEQGTDFSRGKRQQQVILAFKDKLLSLQFWKNPDLLKKLYYSFYETTETDMTLSEEILFIKYFSNSSTSQIRRLTLDTNFLVNPPLWQYDGAWVLVPRSGDFSEIQKFVLKELFLEVK